MTGPGGGSLTPDEHGSVEEILGERQEQMALKEAWGKLSEREQVIVCERMLKEGASRLENLAQRYGIFRERVRQIEGAARQAQGLGPVTEGRSTEHGVRGSAVRGSAWVSVSARR